jgi:hypothetical protein
MSITLTPLADDSFNYANVSPLPSPPWTANTGTEAAQTLQVVSNLCEIAVIADQEGIEFFTGVSLPDDQYGSATLAAFGASSSADLHLQARATAIHNEYFGNGYWAWIYNAGTGYGASSEGIVNLYSYTNGSGTHIAGASGFRVNIGDVYSLAVIGTTVYVLQNAVTTILSVSDSTYASGTTALGEQAASAANVQVSLFSTGSAALNTVTTSTFSPVAGAVAAGTHVTVSNADSALSGFAEYYTTDGTVPTVSSTPYSGPITLGTLPETIKVLAVATGYTNSAIASATYTLKSSKPPTNSVFGTTSSRFGPSISSGDIFGDGTTRIEKG